MRPEVYAELSVFADACGESISCVVEIAVVRFLRARGRKVSAPWLDEDEPRPQLAETGPREPSAALRREDGAQLRRR